MKSKFSLFAMFIIFSMMILFGFSQWISYWNAKPSYDQAVTKAMNLTLNPNTSAYDKAMLTGFSVIVDGTLVCAFGWLSMSIMGILGMSTIIVSGLLIIINETCKRCKIIK